MRALPSLCALIFSLACPAVHAQSAAPGEGAASKPPNPAASRPPNPAPAVKEPVKDIRGQTDAWFKDCKHGWDAGTHMSRRDYERTCLRMAQERVKFMRDWEKPSADRAKTK